MIELLVITIELRSLSNFVYRFVARDEEARLVTLNLQATYVRVSNIRYVDIFDNLRSRFSGTYTSIRERCMRASKYVLDVVLLCHRY